MWNTVEFLVFISMLADFGIWSLLMLRSSFGSRVKNLNEKRLKAMEMDFWRRACGVSRIEHVRNDEIRRRSQRKKDIMDTINVKRLIWYGHVQRMPAERWPKRMLDWVPDRRRKRGSPRRTWRENIHAEMKWRHLQHGDWENRKGWLAGCCKRRQL